jgi:hypothetical protein
LAAFALGESVLNGRQLASNSVAAVGRHNGVYRELGVLSRARRTPRRSPGAWFRIHLGSHPTFAQSWRLVPLPSSGSEPLVSEPAHLSIGRASGLRNSVHQRFNSKIVT